MGIRAPVNRSSSPTISLLAGPSALHPPLLLPFLLCLPPSQLGPDVIRALAAGWTALSTLDLYNVTPQELPEEVRFWLGALRFESFGGGSRAEEGLARELVGTGGEGEPGDGAFRGAQAALAGVGT